MEFTGKIIAVLPAKSGVSNRTGNEWKVQEFVIEDSTNSQYPRRMCFEVFGADKIEAFNIQVGQELKVSFDIDANPWQDRWFNRIRAWKVEPALAANPVNATQTMGAPVPPTPAAPDFLSGDAKDDLPF
ncbi:hypothetical protein EVA_17035 [gut metagenome]|uniref:DUF3127 domain-containing protein n=1 Tax=gut metagenome TaxID=749906 RepID=J9FZ77_9ZZZZ